MTALLAWLAMAGAIYGAVKAGLLGALTGLTVVLLIGTGISIALGRVEDMFPARTAAGLAQRVGGAALIVFIPLAANRGGWAWGWAWAAGAAVATVGVLLVLATSFGWLQTDARATQRVPTTTAGQEVSPGRQSALIEPATSRPNNGSSCAAADIGRCEHCGTEFEFWVFSCGLAGSDFAYCMDCGMTAMIDPSSLPKGSRMSHSLGPVTREVEKLLAPCACGGRFRAIADPRCPSCQRVIDAEYAGTFIEANTPPERRGWWIRSWHRHSGIIINGRSVRNNWAVSTADPIPVKNAG